MKDEFDSNEIIFDKAKILIVDDIEINRQLIRTVLEKYNFDFIEAGR